MRVSLIISTYNRPDALALCLDSVLRQTRMPDEVIIGDDGSGTDTRHTIEEFTARCPVPAIHLWHPDEGFRLALMRNKCIAAANGEYIVQIDGDVVLSRHFISDHVRAALSGHYAKGSRIRLSAAATSRICATRSVSRVFWPFSPSLLKDREKALRLPGCIAAGLSHRYHTKGTGLGANLAFWKSDLVAVNGYNETFTGWGGEDTDLELRLQANGVRTFKMFRCGLVRHLWHNECRKSESMNLFDQHSESGNNAVFTPNGLDKHLNHKCQQK